MTKKQKKQPELQPELHYDVAGKWGGKNAVISHTNEGDYIYLRIGKYFEVGLWPGNESPSQWNICEKFVKFSQKPTIKKLLVVIWYSIKFMWRKR